jgi:hypothetical protein
LRVECSTSTKKCCADQSFQKNDDPTHYLAIGVVGHLSIPQQLPLDCAESTTFPFWFTMGADGGSIPQRTEMVQTRKKDEVVDKVVVRRARWFSCALTGAPLRAPVMCCSLGLLYNKEAVLNALLHKTVPQELGHLRGLSDVFEAKFSHNPAYQRDQNAPVDPDPVSPWVCAVTGREMGINHERFVCNTLCGCVFSLEMARHAPDEKACFHCGGALGELVEINQSDEQMRAQRERLEVLPRKSKKAKKAKKEKKASSAKRDRIGGDAEVGASKKGKEERMIDLAAQKAADRIHSSEVVNSLFSKDKPLDKLSARDIFMFVSK